jgi:hypothetical protein
VHSWFQASQHLQDGNGSFAQCRSRISVDGVTINGTLHGVGSGLAGTVGTMLVMTLEAGDHIFSPQYQGSNGLGMHQAPFLGMYLDTCP